MAQDTPAGLAGKTALITGAARRIGAVLARRLHAAGMNLALHYRSSASEARALADSLQSQRPDSVSLISADLQTADASERIAEQVQQRWGRLDLLVNNASSFYPTPIGRIDTAAWDDLVGSNFKAPLFLSQACAPLLRETTGSIVNIVDIHGLRPLPGHSLYCAAKAALVMLTYSLALDLAPAIRVNAIAPGSILWPEGDATLDPAAQALITESTPLARQGDPEDIAGALLYLATSDFVTAQVLAVDGGRRWR